jgi:transcriptional regulator with XRE-family HTH domain
MSPSNSSIGRSLRALRQEKGMSQANLAAAAGVSRSTIIQMEKGMDTQTSSLEMAGQVLGASLVLASESSDLARRRLARVQQQQKLAAAREKHLNIAVRLALGGRQAAALKSNALAMVSLWREKELCSPAYIKRWQSILDGAPRQIARNILDMDAQWGPALRQNTPFVALPE